MGHRTSRFMVPPPGILRSGGSKSGKRTPPRQGGTQRSFGSSARCLKCLRKNAVFSTWHTTRQILRYRYFRGGGRVSMKLERRCKSHCTASGESGRRGLELLLMLCFVAVSALKFEVGRRLPEGAVCRPSSSTVSAATPRRLADSISGGTNSRESGRCLDGALAECSRSRDAPRLSVSRVTRQLSGNIYESSSSVVQSTDTSFQISFGNVVGPLPGSGIRDDAELDSDPPPPYGSPHEVVHLEPPPPYSRTDPLSNSPPPFSELDPNPPPPYAASEGTGVQSAATGESSSRLVGADADIEAQIGGFGRPDLSRVDGFGSAASAGCLASMTRSENCGAVGTVTTVVCMLIFLFWQLFSGS